MLKEEFIERTGMEVTDEEFTAINQMYLNAVYLNMDEFCEDYKKYHESKLLAFYFDRAQARMDLLRFADEENKKNIELLKEAIVEDCTSLKVRQVLRDLIGEENYLIYLIQNYIKLTDEERELIVKRLFEK